MNDVMLDIETLGTKPGSAIVQVAAVRFDRKTGVSDEVKPNQVHCRHFDRYVDLESNLKLGLTMDAGTVEWWLQQDDEARKIFEKPKFPLCSVLWEFQKWLGKESCVWGNGATFDNVLMRAAYNACGESKPWSFRLDRDLRTAFDLTGFNPKDVPFEGTKHNALDDCKHQIKCLVLALKG